LMLRGQNALDERLTAQTFGERQGILLLISLPHPTARHRQAKRRNQAEKRWEYAPGSPGCQNATAEVRHPSSCTMQLACPSSNACFRNEKTRSRLRKPGLLVCRKEGLVRESASPVPRA
jgi:hypothetical protein